MRFKTLCLALSLALLVIGTGPALAGVWFSVVEEEEGSVVERWLPWQGMEELIQDLLQNVFGATGDDGQTGGDSADGGSDDDGTGDDTGGGGQGTTNPPPPGGDGVGTMIDPNGLF